MANEKNKDIGSWKGWRRTYYGQGFNHYFANDVRPICGTEAMFSTGTPTFTKRLKVPTCKKCLRKLGEIL